MRSYAEHKAEREWLANNTPEKRIARDRCPILACDGNLDTGWECTECDHDAMALALSLEPHLTTR